QGPYAVSASRALRDPTGFARSVARAVLGDGSAPGDRHGRGARSSGIVHGDQQRRVADRPASTFARRSAYTRGSIARFLLAAPEVCRLRRTRVVRQELALLHGGKRLDTPSQTMRRTRPSGAYLRTGAMSAQGQPGTAFVATSRSMAATMARQPVSRPVVSGCLPATL